jgi:hypothetical protein
MSIEDIEMDKRRKSLDKDVNKLLDKYLKFMDWDVPDVNELKARKLILDEISAAVSRLKNQ